MNRLTQMSLRTKLVLLYSILLIASVALVSYHSYWALWQLLVESKASHLRARAKPIIEHWLETHHLTQTDSIAPNFTAGAAFELARDLTSRETVAQILDRSGNILASGKRLPEEPTPPPININYLQQAFSGANEINYFTQIRDKTMLVFLIPLRPQPHQQQIFAVIQMSTLLSDITKILFQHASRQLMAAFFILIAGILFGYWLIGFSLKELKHLSTTCQKIAKGNFVRIDDIQNRDDEIGHLAQSFNVMVERLEKLFEAQKRFVANAAHELLTPLTGLRGSLEVLLRGAQDDPQAVNRLSKGMYKQVNHLIRLCEQLLGLSRLENTIHLKKQPIVLMDFINELPEKARHLLQNHHLNIQSGPAVNINADPDLLEQIFLNLLSNAARHAPAGTPITISWRLLPKAVEIYVSDQGPGMDAQTLTRAFEPFFQGKSPSGFTEKGSGLGLTLTKAMVQAHGGSIHIKSILGQGTTIIFTLPF